jgi:pimeloyl-ACP methyl ester carboxylesterase
MTDPTVLLVHGAMHTPWIFNPLRVQLALHGVNSHALQLPSSNPDSAATRGLHEDASTVRAAIEAIDAPVILAAHSYGGVPATWAAAEAPVAHLVYIAAFALRPGDSMMEWFGGKWPPIQAIAVGADPHVLGAGHRGIPGSRPSRHTARGGRGYRGGAQQGPAGDLDVLQKVAHATRR